METNRQIKRTGWGCLIAAALLFAPSLYLHCAPFALRIGLTMALLGTLMGLSLAGATRTRRATLIYLGLFAAFCTGWGFVAALDSASSESLLLPKGASQIWENYPVFLRIGAFFLAVPYPFARWGYHAPDVITESSEPSQEDE